ASGSLVHVDAGNVESGIGARLQKLPSATSNIKHGLAARFTGQLLRRRHDCDFLSDVFAIFYRAVRVKGIQVVELSSELVGKIHHRVDIFAAAIQAAYDA